MTIFKLEVMYRRGARILPKWVLAPAGLCTLGVKGKYGSASLLFSAILPPTHNSESEPEAATSNDLVPPAPELDSQEETLKPGTKLLE